MKETSRLHALEAYEIMDTLPQKELDEITELAAIICGTPISLITFLDSERQWFKSKVGLSISETPRKHAFCQYAIESPNEVMVVEDSWEDERFKTNPLVTGEVDARFYAGAPLVTKDGQALGSLCVIDHQPRVLTQQQLRALELLSKKVVDLFELRKAHQESARIFRNSNIRLFTLTEQSPDVIGVINDSLEITYANRGHAGLSRESLLGRPVWEAVHPEYRNLLIQTCRKVMQTGIQVSVDLKLALPEQPESWVTCNLAPLKEDAAPQFHLMMICTDITERKIAEDKKKHRIKSLEKMLFMISHELRSPVAKILGLAELLHPNNQGLSWQEKLNCTEYIFESALELDKFIRQLTEFVQEDLPEN